MPVSLFNTARVPIECLECGNVRLYLVRDLVSDDSIACNLCHQTIKLDSNEWRAALKETANYYRSIVIG